MTGMKGTLKLNSVAEEEKSKLVLDEADAPPPLVFLSAMAADPRPLRGSASPLLQHRPEAGQPECHRTSASAHGGLRPGATQGPVFFRKLTPPESNKVESASGPSRSRDTLGLSELGLTLEPQRGQWPLRVLNPSTAGR